jgi:hypothetical protein
MEQARSRSASRNKRHFASELEENPPLLHQNGGRAVPLGPHPYTAAEPQPPLPMVESGLALGPNNGTMPVPMESLGPTKESTPPPGFSLAGARESETYSAFASSRGQQPERLQAVSSRSTATLKSFTEWDAAGGADAQDAAFEQLLGEVSGTGSGQLSSRVPPIDMLAR